MTRVVDQLSGVNLAQGMPNFPPPPELIEAAHRAIDGDFHQYAITWGAPRLRQAIAEKYRKFYRMEIEPDRHVTICCGSTETMLSTLLAVLNPGDEVIIFEPFYENYGPGCIISGAQPSFVPLEPPDFTFDPDRLRRAVTPRTRAIICNSPNNPTGKVFSRQELQFIADLCLEHDLLAITDEIYEHIVYDGLGHTPIATLPGMAERTITISGISKSYSVTGWRVGYAIAPPELAIGIRRAHDFVTVGAPHPLQEAAVTALELPDAYYVRLREAYQARRDLLWGYIEKAGFVAWKPRGAYFIPSDAISTSIADTPGSSSWAPARRAGRWRPRRKKSRVTAWPGASSSSRTATAATCGASRSPRRAIPCPTREGSRPPRGSSRSLGAPEKATSSRSWSPAAAPP